MVETFMNGGTVTQDVWVHDQGMANGHYEQVSYEVADKDVSRVTSGANGGEYTPDNTVMEDASANRARGGDNMTSEELDSIQEANTIEADFINGADVMVDGLELTWLEVENYQQALQALTGNPSVMKDGCIAQSSDCSFTIGSNFTPSEAMLILIWVN